MKCVICGQETGSERAKTCSNKCRKSLSRQSVTEKCDISHESVTNVTEKCDKNTKDVTENKSVTNVTSGFWYLNANRDNYIEYPLKRITLIPDGRVTSEWYRSIDFNNLLDEIESKSVNQLEESYYIPAWKVSGDKHLSRKS